MKNSELVKVWALPDNTRVTSKQVSFRLPVHVAAKINALGDLFPNKTKTEIIGDLLTSALESIEYSFPSVKGDSFGMDDDEGNKLFYDVGKGMQFREFANKHYTELEKELGNQNPNQLYDSHLVCTGNNEK